MTAARVARIGDGCAPPGPGSSGGQGEARLDELTAAVRQVVRL